MMKKDAPVPQFEAENYLADEGFLASVSKYGNTAFYAGIALVILFFLLYRFGSHHSANAEADFLSAAHHYDQLIAAKDPTQQEKAVAELQEILKRRPELNADYQGDIAQSLLELNKIETALPLADQTIRRVSSDHISEYLSYAATSLLIEQKQYQTALDAAVSLKTNLKNNDLVNALNLVRIALLQQQLGNRTGELEAWQEWKNFAGWKGTAPTVKTLDPKIYFVVQNYYSQGIVSLQNYIESRLENK